MSRNVKRKKTQTRGSRRSNDCKKEYGAKPDIRNLKSDEDTSKSSNDPAWYASDPILLRDAASYPFSYVTGATSIHDSTLWNMDNITSGPLEQIPGIASFHVQPTVGTSVNATDPINVASQSVYSFVRHANSGHSNYDPADLMLYIMAMANMYSFLVWCQRLYGYALTYDQRNRYIPQDLIRTNNVDPDDLRTNLANFRFWINTLIAKMASFAVPATMSVFSRMSFMYSDYYIEGTSIKEQLYQFVPDGFYKFGLDDQSMGNLTWEAFNYGTLMTVKDVMDYGNTLFDAIWSQEDFGIMSGDILKSYGDRIIKLAQIPEAYSMVPKFDPMVLTQMKNADMFRVKASRISQSATDGTVVQTLLADPYTETDKWYGMTTNVGSVSTMLNKVMLNILKDYNVLTVDVDQPGPDVVIEATRLKVGYDAYKAWLKSGTEIVTNVVLTSSPGVDVTVPPIIASYLEFTDEGVSQGKVEQLYQVAKNFHYIPRIWSVKYLDQQKKFIVSNLFDVDNFTLLTNEDVIKLHEAATINMFAVPSIGKV